MNDQNKAGSGMNLSQNDLCLKIIQSVILNGRSPEAWPENLENAQAWKGLVDELVKSRQELSDSETLYRLMTENAADVIWTMDLSGKYVYISPSVQRLRGFTVEEAKNQTIEESLAPGSAKLVREKMSQIAALVTSGEKIPNGTYELEQIHKNGSTLWIEVTISGLYNTNGQLVGIQGVSRDISERRRAQEAELEQRVLAEALRDTAAALNSAMNRDQVFDSILTNLSKVVPHDTVDIILVSDGVAKIVRTDGYQKFLPEMIDKIYELRLPIDTTPNLRIMNETGQPLKIPNLKDFSWVETEMSGWANSHLGVPIQVKGKTNGFLILLSKDLDFFSDEHVIRLQAFADQAAIAIEKAQLFEQLNEMATIDSMTGIPNRRYFFNLAEAEITRTIRYNHPLAALMMDIDHFKLVNDTYGHSVGDQVLQAVAKRCVESMRNNDLVGRYGGEEFAFILPETDINAAAKVADRLRKLIAGQPFQFHNDSIRITVSIGIAQFKRDIPSARALLDQADLAMYSAKQAGRNRVVKMD